MALSRFYKENKIKTGYGQTNPNEREADPWDSNNRKKLSRYYQETGISTSGLSTMDESERYFSQRAKMEETDRRQPESDDQEEFAAPNRYSSAVTDDIIKAVEEAQQRYASASPEASVRGLSDAELKKQQEKAQAAQNWYETQEKALGMLSADDKAKVQKFLDLEAEKKEADTNNSMLRDVRMWQDTKEIRRQMDALGEELRASAGDSVDVDAVLNYARYERDKTQREEEKETAKDTDLTAFNQAVAVLGYVPGAIASAADITLQQADRWMTGSDQPINPYSEGQSLSRYTQNVVEGTGENIQKALDGSLEKDGFTLGKAVSFVYQSMMSGLQSASASVIGGPAVTRTLIGLSAGTQAFQDASEKGASDAKSYIMAGISGALEATLGYLPIKDMNALKTVDPDSFKTVLKNIRKIFLSEGLEEGATQLFNDASEMLVLGDLSTGAEQYDMAYQNAIAAGKSEKEAEWAAIKQTARFIIQDVGLAALGGGIAGGTMGGFGTAIGYFNNRGTGRQVQQAGNVDSVVQAASETGNAELMALAKEVAGETGGKEASAAKVGSLVNQTAKETAKQYSEKADAAMAGKVKSRLESLGVSESESGALAAAVYKQAKGERLSRSEKNILKSSAQGQRVASELANAEDPGYDSGWVKTAQESVKESTKSEVQTMNALRNAFRSSGVKVTSEDGTKTAKAVGFVKAESGGVEVKLNDGTTASVSSLQFDDQDTKSLFMAANSLTEKSGASAQTADLFVSGYQGGSVAEYFMDFARAYNIGHSGVDFTAAKNRLADSDLSAAQLETAFYAGKSDGENQTAARQGRLDSLVKSAKEAGVSPKAGSFDESAIKGVSLTQQQADSIEVLRGLSQAFGLKIKLTDSSKNGFGKDGRRIGQNGSYDQDTNTIEVDIWAGSVYAQNLETAILNTTAHEMTHYIQNWSPAQYNTLKSAVLDGLSKSKSVDDLVLKKQMAYSEAGQDLSYEEALDEVVADACETMLHDPKWVRQLCAENRTLGKKIKQWVDNIIRLLENALKGVTANSEEAKALEASLEDYRKAQELWRSALKSAMQADQAARVSGGIDIENTGKPQAFKNNAGDTVAAADGNGNVVFSMRTYENGGKSLLDKYLKRMAAWGQLTKSQADDIRAGMDYVYMTTREALKANPELVKFTAWSEAEPDLDIFGRPYLSWLVSNNEYPMDIDASQVCTKRVPLNRVLNKLVAENLLDVAAMSKEDFERINNVLVDHGFQVGCKGCYVDAKRYRTAEWATKLTGEWNAILEAFPKGEEALNAVFKELSVDEEGKPLKKIRDSYEKLADLFFKHPELMREMAPEELISSKGLENLKKTAPDAYSWFITREGSGSPKAALSETPYANELLASNSESSIFSLSKSPEDWTPQKAFMIGGVRLQSFSDYMPHLFFDYCQMFADMATKRLPMHGYTKVLEEIEMFGRVGAKINMSLFPEVRLTKEEEALWDSLKDSKKADTDPRIKAMADRAGLDENGEYAWSNESFPVEDAFRLQADPEIGKNCGTVAVGVSDAHIWKLLKDPRMKMVIPYHRSGLNPAIAKMTKVALFNDYTAYQNAKKIEFKKDDSKTKIEKKRGAQKKDGESWPDYYRRWADLAKDTGLSVKAEPKFEFYEDLIETEDPVQTSRNYVEYCQENGIIPKFPQFVYNEDGSFNEQYYKVLADFSLYDADGKFSPQQVVRWGKDVLPENWQDLLLKALRAQQATEDRLNTEIDSVVRDVLKAIGQDGRKGKTAGKKQFSMRQSDIGTVAEAMNENRSGVFLNDSTGYFDIVQNGVLLEDVDFDTKEEAEQFYNENKSLIERYNPEYEADEFDDDFYRSPAYATQVLKYRMADFERKKVKRTSLFDIQKNLDQYRLNDLISLGNQMTDSNWDDLEELPRAEIVEGIREIISERADELSVLEMQHPRYGYYVRPVIQKADGKKQFSLRGVSAQDEKILKSHFGVTKNPELAGYMLTDGTMLDFSGKHWGDTSSDMRQVDHRDITELEDVFGDMDGNEAIVAMLSGGEIRLSPESGGINLEKAPTDSQKSALRRYFNHFSGAVSVDIDDAAGSTVHSWYYDEGTSSTRILSDLEKYFSDGVVPEIKHRQYQIRQGGSPVEAENARLRRQVELLKEEFKLTDGHKMNKNAINVLAGRLLRQYSSGYDRDLLESRLYEFFNSIANDSESSWFSFMDGATEIMTDVLEQSSRKEPSMRKQDPLYEELYQMLSAPITLRPDEYRSITAAFGKPERGRILGLRVKNGDETTPSLDVLHSTELIERFRGYFSHDQATAEDIFLRMAEVRDAVNETTVVNDYGQDMEMASRMAAEALFEDYLNVPEKKTMADKTKAKVVRQLQAEFKASRKAALKIQKAEYEERLRAVRKELNEQQRRINKAYDFGVADQRLADDIYFAGKLARAQSRMQRKYENLKSRKDKAFADYKERRRMTELRGKITRLKDDLSSRVLRPTDGHYVPSYLVRGAIDVAAMLDTVGREYDAQGNPTKTSIKHESVRNALLVLKSQYDKMANDPNSDYATEYDPEFSNQIDALAEAIGSKPVRDMSYAQLQDVYSILRDIRNTITDAVKQIREGEAITNYQMATDVIGQVRTAPLPSNPAKGTAEKVMVGLAMNPLRAARRMAGYKTGGLSALMDDLAEGMRKKNLFAMNATKKFDSIRDMDQKAYEDAAKREVEVPILTTDGKNLRLTKMQIMQLVLSWKREQNNENLSHLLRGGFVIPDARLLGKGLYRDAVAAGQRVSSMSQDNYQALYDMLSDWDKRYMEQAGKFFNEDAQRAINETTRVLKHRDVALSKDYIPFSVDQDFVAKEIDGLKYDATLMGRGLLKSTAVNAGQPLVMEGLSNVVNRHIKDVSEIYGLAVPIRNLNKVYNVKLSGNTDSVKKAINARWGKAGTDIIEKLLVDLQAGRKEPDSLGVKFTKTLQDRFVSNALMFNYGVTLKQLSGYWLAGSYIDWPILIKHMADPLRIFGNVNGKYAQDLFNEIDQHTATHWLRRQGMTMREVAERQKIKLPGNADRAMKAALELGRKTPSALHAVSWIENMDNAATAAMWNAAKEQVSKNGIAKSDDRYWKEVASLFDKIIEETQPMYDPLHRAEIQKANDPASRALLLFQSQNVQNYGLIMDTWGEWQAARASHDKAKIDAAKRKMVSIVTSQLVSAVAFVAIGAFVRALRHSMNVYRDDETGNVTMEAFLTETGWELLQAIAPMALPVISDYVVETAENIIKDQNYSLLAFPPFELVNDVVGDMVNAVNNPDEDSLKTLAMDAAALIGVPAKNMVNTMNGFRLHLDDILNGQFLSFEAGYERNGSQRAAQIVDDLLAEDEEAAKEKIDSFIQWKVDGYLEAGKDKDEAEKDAITTVKTAMTKLFKPMYLDAYKKADSDGKNAVISMMKATGIYENPADTCADWAKQYEKEMAD